MGSALVLKHVMRVPVEEFFIEKGLAFTQGRYADLADQIKTPVTVPVGLKQVVFQKPRDVAQFMTAYRQNLLAEGYSETRCDILHVDALPSGDRKVLVRWRNMTASGVVLSKFHTSYLCAPDPNGASWIIETAEVLEDPTPRFSKALPLRDGPTSS